MQAAGSTKAGPAFGRALRELAAAGQGPPVVLQDCLRWLALRGLTTPRLFTAPPVALDRKLLALRHLYDTGRRPLRSKSCRDKDPQLIANLLLLWLGSLPEPLFPTALIPELVDSQQSDYYSERVSSVRALLKRSESNVVEALFPLFELLHHYWINQADRDSCLQQLGRLLSPAVFGTPAEHGLPAEDGGLLSDTVEMLIAEYRPLFTQPFNLRRYEADSARQAAAEAQRAEAAASTVASTPMSSPLLTPIRCERLSVMQPEGASPFSDCCGTPLPASPVSLCLAAAMDASGGDTLGASPPFSPMVASPRQRPAPGFAAFQQHPGAAAADVGADDEEHYHLEQAFSSMLDATVSGMLFDLPLPGDGGDGGDCGGLEHPGSPVAVVRDLNSDGGDTDGSDCDAPLTSASHAFAWARSPHAPHGVATC
ncbi:rho GTPase-activating 4 isoform X2 [Micractinium conductrix]|uniref:Rho GTPase-activating 4 isoform X2 n=1 Tax=Micractinium conductrix TaxID=554055 RepID=A0A2P6V4R7_9CHLO|nr:rho GTPase-activating 4 isoform X2 [Micractinium conductrix]|eukprot:PSC69082.1 rho GTPase-activating 4 isoform X2 [Micractinium conductrix]